MIQLPAYSFGVGDRFGHQGKAQLSALLKARLDGIKIYPVWNKSNREHDIIGSEPRDTFQAAREAVRSLKYDGPWFVDADHISRENMGRFMEVSDFFTLDVAAFIGENDSMESVQGFLDAYGDLWGKLDIPGFKEPLDLPREKAEEIARRFHKAIVEAKNTYQELVQKKDGDFVTEVSMDEVPESQTPIEMLIILLLIDYYKIPAQTIAPKFSGRFNKGVDYQGDVKVFEEEFEQDLLILKYVRSHFDLPDNIKLSIHSGSDKFTIYPIMGRLIKKHEMGIHVKTAGTTWLEEVIGLAMAGGEGLMIAKEIYSLGYKKQKSLCAPYADVIDIDKGKLPDANVVKGWTAEEFARTLRHDQSDPMYNPHFRQLVHIAYKIAAGMGDRFTDALKENEHIIAQQVETNIYERHIKRLFAI